MSDQLINDPEKAAIYAQIMGMEMKSRQYGATGGQSQMGQTGPVPTRSFGSDPTGNGGGNIGTGDIPMPGETGFSATDPDFTRNKQTQ